MGIYIIATLAIAGILSSRQASASIWAISFALYSALVYKFAQPSLWEIGLMVFIEAAFIFFAIKSLRKSVLTSQIFRLFSKAMPNMSATEREALEAGTVSFEGDLFSGEPDFKKLLELPTVQLTAEEQAFLDGPVDTLCAMLDDWEITHNLTDLPSEAWDYIKKNKFLGMIIPKQYGGLEFSATAQMSVLVRLYGRSVTAATTVSVPNSLGPGELLLKYGTEEQKNYYLPRLADGQEIPCFALTGPNAGSDAASIPDTGVVCRGTFNGKEVIGIRLNWNKRYITLCPVATVLGLAFRLFDPEQLLGKGDDIGITCALIPVDTHGVTTGRRHFPLNNGFMNGPTQGKDVFIPLDYVIGGETMVGQGWRMLMECLSAGRAISLPSSASGGAQAAALVCGAYARIRRQFNQSISKFEGIEEPLARIAITTYMIDAGLTMAAAAIDQGEKPSVAGAILKYQTTERGRHIAGDAMDIHGGKGICLGPNNYIGRGYQGIPIGITVEGANILTRCLIIFGQGAIRCHPYVYKEIESVRHNDLNAFDSAFFGHMSFIIAQFSKSIAYGLTDARFAKGAPSKMKRYYQLVQKYSSNLAFLSDFSMMMLGGELKRREKLSARLGDLLSCLYLASAVLKRFHEDKEPDADLPLVQACLEQLMFECEDAIYGVIQNFPMSWARYFLRMTFLPFGRRRQLPSDNLGAQCAKILTTPCETRNRLTRLVYAKASENCPLGRTEEAFHKVCAVEELERKVVRAFKDNILKSLTMMEQIEEALNIGIISKDEAALLLEAEKARQDVIRVDDFSDDELRRTGAEKGSAVKAKIARKKEVSSDLA